MFVKMMETGVTGKLCVIFKEETLSCGAARHHMAPSGIAAYCGENDAASRYHVYNE